MAEGKNTVIIYKDWIELAEFLSNEQAGRLFKQIFKYVNDQQPDDFLDDKVLQLAWIEIRRTLKRDLKAWQKKSSKNAINGQLGNIKRYYPKLYKQYKDGKLTIEELNEEFANARNGVAPASNDFAKLADNDNDNVNDNVNDKENKGVPSLQGFLEHAANQIKKLNLQPNTFDLLKNDLILKYDAWAESKWHTSGKRPHKIKNWKSTLNNTLKYMLNDLKDNPGKKRAASAALEDRMKAHGFDTRQDLQK